MTGLSQVNFDVQGLGDDEEEQLDKEDAEREREIHEILSKELPDDLLDDDNISFTSPHHSGSTHGHRTPDIHTNQSYKNQNQQEIQCMDEQIGEPHQPPQYPHLNKISMLLTRSGEEFIQRYSPEPPSEYPNPTEGVPPEAMPRGFHGYLRDHGGYGEDNEDHRPYTYHDGDDPVVGDSGEYLDCGSGGTGGYHRTTAYPGHDENFNTVFARPRAVPALQQDAGSDGADIIDDFKVEYKRGRVVDVTDSEQEAMRNQAMLGQAAVSPSTVEVAQLQILHRARKRKLEELTHELARKDEEHAREIRVSNHKLALMKGERDGMASSLKHAQELATSRKNEIDELAEKLQNSDFEKERMNGERNEIESELEAAKKTIESLHQQLMQLEKSESLSRAREQHENVVMATKKRHEEDIARLKQKLDDVNNTLMWKDEESKRLQDELVKARKEADRVRLDRAETVNRLTKSLEQSQKQNEELLNSGSAQEIAQLQRELNLTQRDKEDLEERYKVVEADLVDLKEQLRIYESMSKLAVTASDDGVKRNLAAEDWRTPAHGAPSQSKFSTEEALTGLQKELQHSLTSNRTKREEIQQLRGELDDVQKHLVAKENETERLEMLVRKQEIRVLEQEKKIAELEEVGRNPESEGINRKEEIQKLKDFVKEQNSKLGQCAGREQELEKLNLQLKSQMSEMVGEYDADKQQSIEQCRQSCLEFHEQAMNAMKQQLHVDHELELAKLRNELDALAAELAQVKEAYVALSEESRWIEKQTRERCEENAVEKMKEAQARWDEAKTCELLELRRALATEMERALEKEKATWRNDEEEKLKSKLDTELALAKMDWSKAEQQHRKEAIESALIMAEKEWLAKYGKTERQDEWEKRLNDLKQEWEEAKRRELEQRSEELRTQVEQEQEEKLNAARQEWGRLKTLEIDREIEKARKNWNQEMAKLIADAERNAVETAKADWLKEQKFGHDKIGQAREEGMAEALMAAKKEWDREKDLEITSALASEKKKWHTAACEEKEHSIKSAVLLAEERWNSEHVDKVNSAVKEALDLAEAAWRKEKDSAIESAVTQSLRTAKETWNENKIKEIEQILSNARKQWFNELNLTRQESNTSPRSRKSAGSSEDVNKTFSYLEAQYSKNLKEFRETELQQAVEEHERKVRETVKELETKYEVKLSEQLEKHQSELGNINLKAQEDRDAELKDLETEYQSKLENIVEEVEEKWREKKAALEEDWVEKFEKQREELQTSYRKKYQKEREGLAREMREKYEKGVEHARKKLECQLKERLQSGIERAKHDWEAEQEEDRMAIEEQHERRLENEREKVRQELEREQELRISQVQNETLVRTRQLEEELKNEKARYKKDIENLQQELQDMKQRRGESKSGEVPVRVKETKDFADVCKASQTDTVQSQPWISLTEISNETPTHEKLNELRRQYLATTAQLKEDLMQHATETRHNAAKAIRSEVMKERHSTANQLRKYYLECLKQILDEDKEAYRNNQDPRSNEEKLKIMEDRLKLPGEKNETIKSYESTLTNVTTLHDATSESYPITTHHDSPKTSSHSYPTKGSPKKSREHERTNDVTTLSSRPPRIPAVDQRTKKSKGNEGEVDFLRGKRYGEEGNPAHSTRHDGKTFSEELEPNSQGGSSSSETLDSILSPQLDLAPVIEFLRQPIPDNLLGSDLGDESDISGNSNEYRKQEDMRINEGRSRIEHDRREDRRGVTRERSPRESTRSNKRDTHESKRGTHPNERNTHSSQRNTHDNRRDTHAKQRDTQNSRRTDRALSHPVIKSGNVSTRVTSSLRKPVGDVLPSKPLSPTRRGSPGNFSYTMHAQSNGRKTNK